MRVICTIVLLQFILLNCFGQQVDSNEKSPLPLIVPKLTKEDIASSQDYKHCIDLTHFNYILVISGKKYTAANKQELIQLIGKHKKDITKQSISIIYDSTTTPQKMLEVLDIMTEQDIKRFKLVPADVKSAQQMQDFRKLNTSSKEIDLSDSTMLFITIKDTCINISLYNNTADCQSVAATESFIIDNKKYIDPSKIVIVGKKDLAYKDVKPIIALLTKHEYFNFKMLTQD